MSNKRIKLTVDALREWARQNPAELARLRATPTSEEVRRFACFTWKDGVYEHAQGEHVSYTDYERLSRRVAELERQLAEAQAELDHAKNCTAMMQAQAESAQSTLAGLADTVASATRNNGRNSDGIELGTDLREWIWKLSYDFIEAQEQARQAVPREPTEAMVHRGYQAISDRSFVIDTLPDVWRAMWDAARAGSKT